MVSCWVYYEVICGFLSYRTNGGSCQNYALFKLERQIFFLVVTAVNRACGSLEITNKVPLRVGKYFVCYMKIIYSLFKEP